MSISSDFFFQLSARCWLTLTDHGYGLVRVYAPAFTSSHCTSTAFANIMQQITYTVIIDISLHGCTRTAISTTLSAVV